PPQTDFRGEPLRQCLRPNDPRFDVCEFHIMPPGWDSAKPPPGQRRAARSAGSILGLLGRRRSLRQETLVEVFDEDLDHVDQLSWARAALQHSVVSQKFKAAAVYFPAAAALMASSRRTDG